MNNKRIGEIARLIFSWDEIERIYAVECIYSTLPQDELEKLETAIYGYYRYVIVPDDAASKSTSISSLEAKK